ncbi:MAG: hypothetical protein A2309_02255 [Bacteroidetes bacterium RIFOXYB2_FULL_35_7]|nr:MAG: hypothetical protein A2309_02255 [Bacteroidetes bacterium RIFOXYB2_FULL_35_7]
MILNSYAEFTPSKSVLFDTATVLVVNASCYGLQNGSITITATGDNGPYQFSIDSGINWSVNNVFTNLTAGEYDVIVLNNGASVVIDTAIILSQPNVIAVIWDITPVTCHGLSDAVIVMTVTTQFSPHTFLWNTGATTQNLQDIPAGNYAVTVTNSNGCIVNHSMSIDDPDTLILSSTQTDIVCSYDLGSVNLSDTGGVLPYSYFWSNGAQTQDVTDLTAGTHTVTVTDHNNCNVVHLVTISQPPSFLTVGGIVTNVSCNGMSDGEVLITVTGGLSSYTINWSNDSTGLTNTNLVAGIYTVTVSDQNNCHDTVDFQIVEPAALAVIPTVSNPLCFFDVNGAVNITVSGGTQNYSYTWENNGSIISTNEDIANLASGVYYLTIQDANNCLLADSFTLSQPPALQISSAITSVTCKGGSDGAVQATISGGTGIYIQYFWYNSQNQVVGVMPSVSGLQAGNYSFSVTDNNNCVLTENFTITEPGIQTNFFISHLTCNGAGNGAIDLLVSNDTSAHLFLWSNNAVTEDITNIDAGMYSITVTYNSICSIIDSVLISEPPPGSLTIQSSHGFEVCGFSGLTLTAQAGFVSYLWSTGATTQQLAVSDTGFYSVIGRDVNQCIFTDTVYISLRTAPDTQIICMATVDTSSQKNVLIWTPDNDPAIVYYNIYKETETPDDFVVAGTVSSLNAGYFSDNASSPAINNERYKITAVDSCENESDLSTAHKTIFLDISSTVPANSLAIGWFDTYEGFDYSQYEIYRSADSSPFETIDVLSYMTLSYTDYNVPANALNVCYRVAAIMSSGNCTTGTHSYSKSFSNNACYEFPNTINKYEWEEGLDISPNPLTTEATIRIKNYDNETYSLIVKDITGKTVSIIENIKDGAFIFQKNNLLSGMYFLELRGVKNYFGKIVIE